MGKVIVLTSDTLLRKGLYKSDLLILIATLQARGNSKEILLATVTLFPQSLPGDQRGPATNGHPTANEKQAQMQVLCVCVCVCVFFCFGLVSHFRSLIVISPHISSKALLHFSKFISRSELLDNRARFSSMTSKLTKMLCLEAGSP
jgi:hypothetical protein